jgi:hypothetical protein
VKLGRLSMTRVRHSENGNSSADSLHFCCLLGMKWTPDQDASLHFTVLESTNRSTMYEFPGELKKIPATIKRYER